MPIPDLTADDSEEEKQKMFKEPVFWRWIKETYSKYVCVY